MKILHSLTGAVIFESTHPTMKEMVEAAISASTNLRGANLRGADLSGANLSWANLRGANLSMAIEKIPIRDAICARVCATPENLEMSTWHTCETVHCLAGWAVTLHPQGRELEEKIGTNAAATLIFHTCEGEIPDFFSDNETAMKWLKNEN